MTTSNPIIPPGSPLRRTRSGQNPKLLVTICAILTVHLVVLAGLLIQGCKREEPQVSAPPEIETDSLPSLSQAPSPGERLPPLPPEPGPSTQTRPAQTPAPAIPPGPSAPSTDVVAEPGAFSRPESQPLPPPSARPQPSLTPSGTPAAGVQTVYAVKAGDTLTRIARNHGTTVNAIRAANALKTDRILVGQKLKVPATTQPPAPVELPR